MKRVLATDKIKVAEYYVEKKEKGVTSIVVSNFKRYSNKYMFEKRSHKTGSLKSLDSN